MLSSVCLQTSSRIESPYTEEGTMRRFIKILMIIPLILLMAFGQGIAREVGQSWLVILIGISLGAAVIAIWRH